MLRSRLMWLVWLVTLVVVLVFGVGSAAGAVPAPGWSVDSVAAPTDFSVAAGGTYQVDVTNAGSVASEESPIVIRDVLPAGVSATNAEVPGFPASCVTGPVVTCEVTGTAVAPDGRMQMLVSVSVDAGAEGVVTNTVSVVGGGAPLVSRSQQNRLSGLAPSFGPASFSFAIDGVDGRPDTQAGGHPYELTTTIDLNSVIAVKNEENPLDTSVQDVRDIVVDLPLGFVGDALSAPQCTLAQLSSVNEDHSEGGCPPETIIGHLETEPSGPPTSVNGPIYNLVPERGVPAEFGFVDGKSNTHVIYSHVVPTPGGYVLQATSSEISQVPLAHIVASFYGDPAQRDGTHAAQVPFFTNPTECDGQPLTATVWMDSWQNPARLNPDGTPVDLNEQAWVKASSSSPPVTGCNELQFTPELFAQPTTTTADSPSGLEFALKVPQVENTGVLGTPALQDTTVSFPEGMTVDPSSGDGLGACSEAQIGWEGPSPIDFNGQAPACPESSKIGSVEVQTPLLAGTLHGEVFLASQNENPFASTFATYIVINDPTTGVLVKLAGELKLDERTGQITSSFLENPQLPFSQLQLHLYSGPRASLATPDSCGIFTTTSVLAPWSAPYSGPDSTPFDSFPISEGCISGFSPAFTAGSVNPQAGAYTPFQASFSRQDTDQELAGLTLTFPDGLLASVAGVPECGETEIAAARANTGSCPPDSEIGGVTAFAGPGPDPLAVAGKAYLTGPYNGGAYGVAVIVPAIAGPYNFGNVVVRQALRVNPRTSQVTDVSDPFPTILDPTAPNGQTNGVPIKLRRIDVDINRPGFTFNPTSCNPLAFTGALSSTQGAASPIQTPFQAANCQTLKFDPKLTVTTQGKASKADGASLTFKIAYPKEPFGSQTWFNETKFDIPKQLPARDTTLQQACLANTFETSRKACPPGSIIGHAIVHTQILSEPLTGPVYFVSYGSQKFPEAVIVLQGDNITIELHGETFIDNKTGITSATFHNLPDTPFENIEVTIPEGPYSEFGVNIPEKDHYNLCTQKLTMPTHFKASNGQETNQNTPITITGCKTTTRAQKLAAALKACHKHKNKHQRTHCENQAHKKYGHTKTSKKK
jgi:hypothetical protein